MHRDLFFAIQPASHFLWTDASRFIFCNSLSRPFSLDRCIEIYFLQFPQQAIFPGQMHRDLFFEIPPAGYFLCTDAKRFFVMLQADRFLWIEINRFINTPHIHLHYTMILYFLVSALQDLVRATNRNLSTKRCIRAGSLS
jgi:hypothetical protein